MAIVSVQSVFAEEEAIPERGGEGTVNIILKPAGSTVYLDGEEIGKSPIKNLKFRSGRHDLTVLDQEQELIAEELKNSGKPDDIAQKISLGKINKFKEENGLLSQAWVMEPKKKVQDIVKDLSITDLKIKDFYRLKIGE